MRNISGGTRKMKQQQTINNSTQTHTKTLVSYMLVHTVAQQKPIQHWKEIILQFRNEVGKETQVFKGKRDLTKLIDTYRTFH